MEWTHPLYKRLKLSQNNFSEIILTKEVGPIMNVTVLGIDLAKNVFQIHGVDMYGKTCIQRKLKRSQVMSFIENLPKCLIGVEACGSSHYWVRQFKKCGHTVKAMPPQFVKPFVKSNKNDANDAEAICEAVQRPNMRFASTKTVEQQDVQSTHRIRQRLIGNRTALCNSVRGLLGEYGVAVPKGVSTLRKQIPEILESTDYELTDFTRELLSDLYAELSDLQERIDRIDKKIDRIFKASEVCLRLAKIDGVGPLIATAITAAVGDASVFKNGRQMSAWLGLVPRQNSSGGKTNLLGISKRGDVYIRTLLIHGGRSLARVAERKSDQKSKWITEKVNQRGSNRAAIAIANKNVRIIWKMMTTGEEYRMAC